MSSDKQFATLAVHAGEQVGACPYIRSLLTDGPQSVANLEGDRVGRTTILITTNPVGCRFYFAYAPYQAIADIVPYTNPR